MSQEPSLLPGQKRTMDELERLRKTTGSGVDYWLAREIMAVLGYETWRSFEGVIRRAMEACEGNKIDASKHFVGTGKMVALGSDASRAALHATPSAKGDGGGVFPAIVRRWRGWFVRLADG